MTTTIVLLVLVTLTVATILVSRAGAPQHQESLNSQTPDFPDPRERPAGPGAERMTDDPPRGGEDV